MNRATLTSNPISPLTSMLIPELFFTHQLSWCKSVMRHGIWPLDFKIPSYPCIYFKLNTEIAHLFLSATTALSWK